MRLDSVSQSERVTAELRRRLEEAEETIRAIREGEVDALVMRNPRDEDEVFTLEGGTESYRAFMEVMDIGAAAFDAHGRLLYANKALLSLLGRTEESSGEDIFSDVEGPTREAIFSAIRTAQTATVSREIAIQGNAGKKHVQLSASPLRIGLSDGVAVTFADITSRIQALAAQESERVALAIMASANEAVIVCDTNGIITHANAAVSGIAAGNPIGLPYEDVISIVIPEATGLFGGNEIVALAISGTSIQGIEAQAPKAPRIRDVLISAAPLKVGETITGCVVTMVDLSQRKAAEKQQLLLMGELDHRVKNTLALVLSIAKRTGSAEGTIEGFQKAFFERIQGLAATHNILAERSWNAVAIRDIIRIELDPYVGDSQARYAIRGGDIAVTPRAAISLGMVIHELATNAVKYGALSAKGGKVNVDIERTPTGNLALEWKELGGPQVAEPQRKGFGQTVITRSMQYSPDGNAEVRYEPDGVWCRISIPGADVATDEPGQDAGSKQAG